MEYIRPRSVSEISRLLDGRNVYFIAGGTDIMVLRKEGRLENRPFVDISGLEELKGISEEEGYLDIGALTTMSEISENGLVGEKAAALAQAASEMGSPLIRNLATLGGNLANSSPAGDVIPPLSVLDAVLLVQKGEQKRELPACGFCTAPGCSLLESGEIITRIHIPVLEGSASNFMKLGSRKALAISKVSVAAWWFMDGKEIVDIRISLGAVGPRCLRAEKTEKLLKRNRLTPDILEAAAAIIQTEAMPIDDFRSTADYRRAMTGVLLKRILAGSR